MISLSTGLKVMKSKMASTSQSCHLRLPEINTGDAPHRSISAPHRRHSALAHPPSTNPGRSGLPQSPKDASPVHPWGAKAHDKWVVGKQFAIIPHELFFMTVRNEEKIQEIQEWQRVNIVHGDRIFFSADDDLQYFPFCADFGPMNFGMTYRFIQMLKFQLDTAKRQGKMLVYFTMNDPVARTNTATLMALYLVIERGWTAEEAILPLTFGGKSPFLNYRDASFQPITFELTLMDIARGVEKAKRNNMIDLDNFDIEMYEYCDHPSMADLHVVVPGKFVAMKGPHTKSYFKDGVQFLAPSHYLEIFQKLGVTAVVRLNNEQYDAEIFRKAGLNHYDIYFDDCTVPDKAVLEQWWEVCRKEKGAIAVHCKAGLGRTGTLICLWLMRKYKFTGREAIGYNRVMRPGSVLGPQQEYLQKMEAEMWHMGDPDDPFSRSRAGSSERAPQAPERRSISKIAPPPPLVDDRDKVREKEKEANMAKILAQENTEAMNRRAAQMTAATFHTGAYTKPLSPSARR